MKKKLSIKAIIVASALFVSIFGIGAIAAYFTAVSNIENVIEIGNVETPTTEEFETPRELHPGSSFKKAITVSNTGKNVAAVRVKASFSSSVMDSLTERTLNSNYWWDGNDGYYYYRYPLNPGKDTLAPLWNGDLKIKNNADANLIEDFEIYIYTESRAYNGSLRSTWQDVISMPTNIELVNPDDDD